MPHSDLHSLRWRCRVVDGESCGGARWAVTWSRLIDSWHRMQFITGIQVSPPKSGSADAQEDPDVSLAPLQSAPIPLSLSVHTSQGPAAGGPEVLLHVFRSSPGQVEKAGS
jgi:hypothetical protein